VNYVEVRVPVQAPIHATYPFYEGQPVQRRRAVLSPQLVHPDVCGQGSNEVDPLSRDIEMVPPGCQLAYETASDEPVAMGPVIGQQRRGRQEKDAKRQLQKIIPANGP
jgi:hypothetical protein